MASDSDGTLVVRHSAAMEVARRAQRAAAIGMEISELNRAPVIVSDHYIVEMRRLTGELDTISGSAMIEIIGSNCYYDDWIDDVPF